MKRRLPSCLISIFIVLLIVMSGILIYSNVIDAPFTFDDSAFIVDNPTIKDFGYLLDPSKADGLKLKDVVLRYLKTRTFGYFTFWANYKLGGLNARGYHVFNVAVHVANAILVYFVVVLLFRSPALAGSALSGHSRDAALLSGLLFVVHPVMTESIAYTTQRFGALATMFYLASVASYIRSRLADRRVSRYGFYAIALLAALLAMKCKEIAFTLPVAIVLCEFIFLRGSLMQRAVRLFPFVLTMLVIPMAYLGEYSLGEGLASALQRSTRLQTEMPREAYLFTESRVLVTYLRLLLLPVNQNVDYDYPRYDSAFEPQVLFSFFILAALSIVGLWFLGRSRKTPELKVLSLGVFWFFLTLSVESSLIPISETIFEYRLCLPFAGIAPALGTALFMASRGIRDKSYRTVFGVLVAFLLIVMGVAAHERNSVWGSELSLWKDAATKSPLKARPFNNLGLAYHKLERYDDAVRQFVVAIRNDKRYDRAYANLGATYYKMEQYDEAANYYALALMINPDFALARFNLGVLRYKQGRIDEAEREFLVVLNSDPSFAQAHYSLALIHEMKGNNDEAIRDYKRAIDLMPHYADARNGLGMIYLKQGRYGEAVMQLRKALQFEPENSLIKANLKLANSRIKNEG